MMGGIGIRVGFGSGTSNSQKGALAHHFVNGQEGRLRPGTSDSWRLQLHKLSGDLAGLWIERQAVTICGRLASQGLQSTKPKARSASSICVV
jgi:hypothetical protein